MSQVFSFPLKKAFISIVIEFIFVADNLASYRFHANSLSLRKLFIRLGEGEELQDIH